MSGNVVDQIVESLRNSGSGYFPEHSELRAVRVVGHTPKPDYYTYEIVLDFERVSERVNAKVYRAGKVSGARAARTGKERSSKFTICLSVGRQAKTQRSAASGRRAHGTGRRGEYQDQWPAFAKHRDEVGLLSGCGTNHRLLQMAASQAGDWLQRFHKATSAMPVALDTRGILADLEKLCSKAQKDGLPKESTEAILSNARTTLRQQNKPVRSSAVLNDFAPLNVLVAETGVGFSDFANLQQQGNSLQDAAMFLAAVEALEKYPFCDRSITTPVQEAFMQGYGVSEQDKPLLTVLKMRVLLQMFAQGRVIKETAVRKKVMWANVMKRFIQQAAERSLAPAA